MDRTTLLPQFSERSKQVLQSAISLEARYKNPNAETEVYLSVVASAASDEDGDNFQNYAPCLPDHEETVRTGLLGLIGEYESIVNDAMTSCAINFSNSRNQFAMLFDIWITIRRIYDIIKYASVWEAVPKNDGQMSLEVVERMINETLLRYLVKGQDPLFKNAISHTFNNCMTQMPQQQQQNFPFQAEPFLDPQAQQTFHEFDYLLDFFHDAVNRAEKGTLSVWRREQKKAMLGIGQIKDMAPIATKPAIALQNATSEFQDLARIWLQIDRLAYMFCSNRLCSPEANALVSKVLGLGKHLLQSSLIVDWRYNELCQPHIVIRSKAKGKEKEVKEQKAGVHGKARNKEKVHIIVKVLAAVDSFTPDFLQQPFPPLICAAKSTITAQFVKPVNNAVALAEDIAITLRDNTQERRDNFINRAGDVTSMSAAKRGELMLVPAIDANDKTVVAEFFNVAFTLADRRRSKATAERNACTKYHIDATAQVMVNSALSNMSTMMELKTLSTPFCCSVGNTQDKKLYKSFLWNLLGSHPDSVSCHCLPLNEDELDTSMVYWGDYRDALKWLFFKLTLSRTLYDDELKHLGFRLFATEDLPASKTFDSQRGEPDSIGFSRIRTEKKNKFAPFFSWYFEALELILDRSEAVAQPKQADKSKPKLTMAKLFETGMILGFISRTGAEELLKASDRNAMIIRFSDHFSGHITVSYINKETENSKEKLEHVRPLAKALLAGMGLPCIIAMLINLRDVDHIIASRLAFGQTTLTLSNLQDKNDLIRDHLKEIDCGEFDQYEYASQIGLQASATQKESQAADAPSTSRTTRATVHSPPTPSSSRQGSERESLFEQHLKDPRMIRLLQELEEEKKGKKASSNPVSPWSSTTNQSIASPYTLSQMSPMPSSVSQMSQMSPMPNASQPYNQSQSPALGGFGANSMPTASTTFMQQGPYMPSQFTQMPVQSPNQTPAPFNPISQVPLSFQPPNPQMMQQQQQPMMGQNGQWSLNPQTANFTSSERYGASAQSGVNPMQNYPQQQQLHMGIQHMNIGSSFQQPHQRPFAPQTNQYPQQQAMMQQSAVPQMSYQQMTPNFNMQPQAMPTSMVQQQQSMQPTVVQQQQPMQSSMVQQQQQQGMMPSSFAYQPQQQQQMYPQYQQQQFLPQQFVSNVPTLHSLQTPGFQGQPQVRGTDDESTPENRSSFDDDELYEEYEGNPAKTSRH